MSFQDDIFTALSSDASVTGIVGTGIFSDFADGQTHAPFLVYQTISKTSPVTHTGTRSVEFPLIQITAWAKTRSAAINLAEATISALEGRELPGKSETSCWFTSQISNYDQEAKLYGEIIELSAATTR